MKSVKSAVVLLACYISDRLSSRRAKNLRRDGVVHTSGSWSCQRPKPNNGKEYQIQNHHPRGRNQQIIRQDDLRCVHSHNRQRLRESTGRTFVSAHGPHA